MSADTFTSARFLAVLDRVDHPEFAFRVEPDGLASVRSPEHPFNSQREVRYCLRVVPKVGVCNATGEVLAWKGRHWRLSPHMTDGEIVQTAFMAALAAIEHETRERFTYKGVSVFDPHYDIDKLAEFRSGPGALKERS